MNVIVGKAMRHETPVFDRDMRYVVFRPYWNVPPSIQRSEIVPAITRNRNYIAQKNYEVTTHSGQVVTSGPISDEVLEQLRAGKLAVRQKPGPTNSLGLVKLIFPNEYNVYLHSTPAQQLFSQTRRDFSHGCIRVEKPAELTAWALQGRPEWALDKVRAAMSSGKDNQQVNLPQPIPVLILYVTAVPAEAMARCCSSTTSTAMMRTCARPWLRVIPTHRRGTRGSYCAIAVCSCVPALQMR